MTPAEWVTVGLVVFQFLGLIALIIVDPSNLGRR